LFTFGIILRILLLDFLLDDTCVLRSDKILSSFELKSSRLGVPGVVVARVVLAGVMFVGVMFVGVMFVGVIVARVMFVAGVSYGVVDGVA